ncbi:MAG: arsinothricin resistance N-acetyltransferase ArsN1 family B [Pseudomonadota bacterium]
MAKIAIRDVLSSDAGLIVDIYNHYIEHTIITFEEAVISAAEMASRISETWSNGLPFLVAEYGDQVVGYAYASAWKGRCAYRYSVETTVYLAPDMTGKGVGYPLYQALFSKLREGSIHVAIAGIALPNEASVALHEKCGMYKVGQFVEVGFKFDRYIDVGYWQLSL